MSANGTVNGGWKVNACAICAGRLESLFSVLPKEEVLLCQTHRVVHTFHRGETIFHEGERPKGLHCLSSGKVKLLKAGEHGKHQIIRIVKAGDVMGHRSLLLDEPYRATAQALEDSTVCLLPRDQMFDALQRYPAFSRKLLQRLARELGDAEQRLLELVDTPALQRLAKSLMTLSRRFGKADTRGVTLEIPLTREEIGEIIGTTPETTIRMLSHLRAEGVVSLGRRRIGILNQSKLTEIAEHGEP